MNRGGEPAPVFIFGAANGGFFTGNLVSYFLFGGCLGLLIKHLIEDSKKKK